MDRKGQLIIKKYEKNNGKLKDRQRRLIKSFNHNQVNTHALKATVQAYHNLKLTSRQRSLIKQSAYGSRPNSLVN